MRQKLFLILLLLLFLPLYSQTIRIAAIRVQFHEDDNTLTTGNGLFRMDSTHGIDPAPHNRTYFKDQIIAADNYFNAVSGGRVRITGDIFPKGLNAAYDLNNEMKHYNPNTSQKEINNGIASLFVDAVQKADADPVWNFSDYDLVVIFHAGVGKDIDLGFDETPQDIPSLYITPKFLTDNWNSSFSGISVDNGTYKIDQGIVLPETENQDGIQIALTGMLVSNIGSYLGLYDLFSADKQRSGVGQFGLMDAGLFNFNGLVPAPPSAFHRKLLKWDTPLVLNTPTNNQRIANKYGDDSGTDPSLIEIPINEDEYYLLEYRGVKKENTDSLIYELSDQRDSAVTYLDLLNAKYESRRKISDSSGVLLSVDNYDLGLPGRGVLIWHIDKSVIRNSKDNIINNDPSWRAVDLEEADGSQDIGEQYDILQSGSELGWLFDFWYKGNDSPLYKNEFSSTTIPDTRSNLNHAETGIIINNFSNYNNDFMTFSYNRMYYENGFPVNFKMTGGATYSVSGIPYGKQKDYLFTMNDAGEIFAVGNDGKGLFYDKKYLIGRVSPNSSGVFSLALADTNTIPDNIYDFLMVMSGHTLYNFDLYKYGSDSLAQLNFNEGVKTADVKSPLVVSNRQVFFVDAGTFIQSYYISDTLSLTIQNAIGYINDLVVENGVPFVPSYNVDYVAKINEDQIISAVYQNSGTEFSAYNIPDQKFENSFSADSIVDQFSLADIDGNGTADILFNTKNQICIKNQNGTSVVNFPVQPVLTNGEELIGTPLVVDLSGDGNVIVISATNKGQFIAYDKKGQLAEGFPFAAGGNFSSTPVIMQIDDDPAFELAAVSDSGYTSVWEIPGTGSKSKIIWGSSNFNNSNNAIFQFNSKIQPLGNGLIPKARFFNYPNPNKGDYTTIRYYLNEESHVTIRIFDTAGYKVDEFTGPGMANTENEINWRVSNISSGVYICQLEAISENYSERKIIKIMVVH